MRSWFRGTKICAFQSYHKRSVANLAPSALGTGTWPIRQKENCFSACVGAEATVRPGHYPLPPDNVGITAQTLRNQLWMLDEVAGGVNHARHQNFILVDFGLRPIFPLMFMARVSALEQQRRRRALFNRSNNFFTGKSCVCGPA